MSTQIRDWLHAAPNAERERVATEAGTSVAYLWQLAGGHRKATFELAARLLAATRGALTLEGMRPDLEPLLHSTKKKTKRVA